MTLFVFPDPRVDFLQLLIAARDEHAPAATIGKKAATTLGTVAHIQYAWDGTPGQQVNRQVCAMRVTVWGWKVQTSATTSTTSDTDLGNLAQLLLAYLLEAGSDVTWQIRPGAGPIADVDDASKIPFCTFTVNAETRPSAVA